MHGTFLQKTEGDSSNSYNYCSSASIVVISTHPTPFSPSWHMIQKQLPCFTLN